MNFTFDNTLLSSSKHDFNIKLSKSICTIEDLLLK